MNARINRTIEMLEKIAGNEDVTIRFDNGKFDVFGSELAILRLAIKYRDADNTRHGYSENLKTWYFVLECNTI